MTTTNKNFKVKNGLEVLGTSATVNGNDVLTTASSVDDLVDVSTSGAVEGQALVFDASLNLIPGTVSGGGGGASGVITSDTKPSPATDGLEWHDTTDGNDYISVDGVWVGRAAPASVSSAVDIRLTTAETNIIDLEQQVRPVILGGTGATTAADARTNLEAAAASHTHSASDVSSGQFVHGRLPTGSTLQIVQTVKTNSFAASAGAVWGDIPGMTATITPKFSNSQIFVMVDVKAAGTNDNSVCRTKIQRVISGGSYTDIYVGDAASNRPRVMSEFYMASGGGPYYMAQMGGNFLDSPATTSAVTYKVQIGGDGTGNTLYVNRTQGDRDTTYYDGRGVSSITLMEIAG